jgi:MFS family permease
MAFHSVSRRISRIAGVLRISDFAWYQAGNATSLTGYWTQRVAAGWLAWDLTHSTAWLGAVAFAEFAPSVVFSLIGGILADRRDRVQLLRLGQTSTMLLSGLLAILHATGLLNIYWLVAVTGALGLVAGLNLPSRLAVAPSLVDAERLPAAVAVNSISFNMARFVGPALAAVLLVTTGATVVFALNALAFGFFSYCLTRVRWKRSATESGAAAREGIFAAVHSLLADRRLGAVILLQAIAGLLLRPASEIFPAFADTVFARGAPGLAWLNAALGVGAVLGALYASGQGGSSILGREIWWSSLFFAASLAGFALTGLFWPALILLVLHGIAMAASGISSLAYVQMRAPADKLGRILSIYGLIFRAAPAVGALGIGMLAEWAGLSEAVLAVGVLALILIAATAPGLLKDAPDAAGSLAPRSPPA